MHKLILDGITWSFSSVNCYANCPRAFLLSYINCVDKTNNAFAEWGSFGHSLLERYFKSECEFFELSNMYSKEYDENITLKFPPNKYVDLNESYREAGKVYFDNFEGLPDYYEVIGIEQKISVMVGKYIFTGYIDLIIKDKRDGEIIIYDHKSKSKFKNKAEHKEYLRQLYLYSIYIYNKYNKYPKQLIFNMFRAGNEVAENFNLEDYEDAKQWFINTIDSIYRDCEFLDKIFIEYNKKNKDIYNFKYDDFFCNWLCGVKNHCKRSDKYKI